MDFPFAIDTPVLAIIGGALLGVLLGTSLARWMSTRWPHALFGQHGYRARRRYVAQARAGEADLATLGRYAMASLPGMNWFHDHVRDLWEYAGWCDPDTSHEQPFSIAEYDTTAAGSAILLWLHHDPDWDMLVLAMKARLQPAELVAHALHEERFTLEDIQFLLAMRGPDDRTP